MSKLPLDVRTFVASLPTGQQLVVERGFELVQEMLQTEFDARVEDIEWSEVIDAEDHIESAVESAMEEVDFDKLAEDAVDEAAREYDFDDLVEDSVERAVREFDIGEAIENALEEAEFEETKDRCEELLEETDKLSSRVDEKLKKFDEMEVRLELVEAISHGGFWRRLRWLLTGK